MLLYFKIEADMPTKGYCKFTLVNYIGYHDKSMLLAGGCGNTNGKPQIDKTEHLSAAYQFGKEICKD